MRNKVFREEFYYFLNKFKNHENFNLLRFSDGEVHVLQNRECQLTGPETTRVEGLCDGKDGYYSIHGTPRPKYDQKHFQPQNHSLFRDYLIASFLYNSPNFYKGISCKCCVGDEHWNWQLSNLDGDSDNLTWSNVLLNSNYPLFMEEFYPEIKKRKAYVVCNESADLSLLPWVKHHFKIRTDVYDNFASYVIELKKYISKNNIKNKVFLFSASSLSNILQYELAKEFPENTYIDIGTTLSYEFGIPVLRGYIHQYYNNQPVTGNCIWG